MEWRCALVSRRNADRVYRGPQRAARAVCGDGGNGGEPRKITSVNSGVDNFRWAPDGNSIAFTTEEDRDSHPQFRIVKSETSRIRLLRVAVDGSAKPEEILDGAKYAVHGFDWSPDGGQIAFQDEGIFTLDVATRKVTAVTSGAGPYRNPMWSPDGQSIAFETAGGAAGFSTPTGTLPPFRRAGERFGRLRKVLTRTPILTRGRVVEFSSGRCSARPRTSFWPTRRRVRFTVSPIPRTVSTCSFPSAGTAHARRLSARRRRIWLKYFCPTARS